MIYKDKKNVFMVSTFHSPDLKCTGKKNRAGNDILKPAVILDHNRVKGDIDLSDQMISYYSPARKSVKWYRKILFQCISIAVLNSWVLYNRFYAPQKKMILVSFIKSIASSLLYVQETSIDKPTREAHFLVKIARGPEGKINRKRCNGYYARISKDRGRKEAVVKTKKVDTQCTECKKAFCLECFNQAYSKKVN